MRRISSEGPIWSWSCWIWQGGVGCSHRERFGWRGTDSYRALHASRDHGGARSSLTILQWKVRDITRDLNKSISHASRYLHRQSCHPSIHSRNVRAEFWRAAEVKAEMSKNSQCIRYIIDLDLLLLRRRWLIMMLFIGHAKSKWFAKNIIHGIAEICFLNLLMCHFKDKLILSLPKNSKRNFYYV